MFSSLRHLIGWAIRALGSRQELVLENLALREQLLALLSAKNEQEAQALGVKKVALPARGRLSAKRAEQQKQRWFRRGLRWRAGIEATISTLKHPFSMWRATYKGGLGFERYVGWCVITKNLFSIARYQAGRNHHGQVG